MIEPDNLWQGVVITDQTTADERIPGLLATPAAVRFVWAKLVGPVDLSKWLWRWGPGGPVFGVSHPGNYKTTTGDIDWVIVSGGDQPMHPDWVRSLRDQCVAAGVSFCFRGWGEWLPQENESFQPKEYGSLNRDGRFQRDAKGVMTHSGWTGVGRVGKEASGRMLDGRIWDEFPEVAR